MDDEVLMDLVTEAFPIVVFTKQLENKKRKVKDKIGEIHDNLLMEQITVALQIQLGVYDEYN